MSRLSLASIVLFLCLATRTAAQQETTAPREIPPDQVQSLLLKRVAPIYPPLARQARIQGTVILDIVIGKEGDVGKMQLFSGHPMLAPAAIEAVKQWKYRPYEEDGQSVEIKTTVQIKFTMQDTDPVQGVAGDAPGGLPSQSSYVRVHPCETPADGSAPKRVRVSAPVIQGLVLEKVNPDYPEEARRQHVEGSVVMAIEIAKNGAVCDIALISGHPLLAPTAIDAVRQWRYKPYLLDGERVEVQSQAVVSFTLRP